eukprot:3866232-Pleurochrysis_carterae.AAC.5
MIDMLNRCARHACAGFVPGVHAENVISGGYSRVVSEAEQVRARQQTSAGSSMRSSKSLPYLWT